jgi:hypothetical protein
MKTLARMSVLLLFFTMSANAQNVESKVEKMKNSTPEVVAIHEIELLPGVDAKEFEAFVLKELVPIYSKMKGQKLIFVKGDRGVHTGQYAFILTFESVEDRDRIYPPSGGFVGDFGDESMWKKFESMATGMGTVHTDYVKVNR